MRLFLLTLFLAASAFSANYRSLTGETGKYGNTSIPAGAPWSTNSVLRVEFRLHSWTGTGRIFQWDSVFCTKNANDITCTSFYDAGTPSLAVAIPTGATDVIVRFYRDATSMFLEIWSADGSLRTSGSPLATSAATINLASTTLAILHTGGGGSSGVPAGLAWFRVYSTSVSFDSAMPTNVAGGDLLDYELEGDGTDTSGRGLNITLVGSPSFGNTPVVPLVGPSISIRSMDSFTPSCAGTAADSYAWAQQGAAPLAVTFSDNTNSAPTVTGIGGFGQYSLTCTATVNGVIGTSTLLVGAVATNPAGVVIVSDPVISKLLGPQLRANVSEWTWYDRTRALMGDYWYTQTSSYTTDFTSTEAQNYYDACLVQYANYYRTGLTKFQTYARACVDKWWSQYWEARATAGTCGENWLAPRGASLLGIMIRAYELGESAVSNRWTCITAYTDFHLNLWVEMRGIAQGYTAPYFGVRESGYAFIHAVGLATAHPTLSVRTDYTTRVSNQVSNYARGLQCQTGSAFQACLDNYTTGAGTISVTNGSATVTGSGSAFTSLFTGGDSIAFADLIGDANYYLTVSSVGGDTSLTLSAPYAGTSQSGLFYAKRVTANTVIGNWREEAPASDLIGFGSFDWQNGILLEGMMRAHAAGIQQALVQTITTDFTNYLLNNSRTYPTQACTGTFPTVQARRIVYSVWFGGGDQGTGCSSQQDVLDSRQANSLVVATPGFTYLLTGSASALTRGDDMWSATFGSWVGTGSDGLTGLGATTGNNGRFYGQSYRDASYLVSRLGSAAAATTAVPVNLSVNVRIADIPTATKVRLTLTNPDNTTSVATCTSMPCVVTGDSTQGSRATLGIEYLNVSDQVRSSGQVIAVRVQ